MIGKEKGGKAIEKHKGHGKSVRTLQERDRVGE